MTLAGTELAARTPSAEFGYRLVSGAVCDDKDEVGRGEGAVTVLDPAAEAGRLAPHGVDGFFASPSTASRRDEPAVVAGGGPAALDSIGSGRRESRRFVSSTL